MRWRLPLTPTRPLHAVPPRWRGLLLAAFLAQLGWHALEPAPEARARPVPEALPLPVLRLAALGEPATLATAGTLWLQYFDEQPGESIPFRELDYHRVRDWLARWSALDPDSGYPLLLAVRIYAQVSDPARQRIMLEFVLDRFLERPGARWRWLAEAAILARHRLHDDRLALRYARLLAEHTRPGEVPHWARDLQILLLEDIGELEAAKVLIGGLLANGEIRDPNEIRYLEQRLEALKERTGTENKPEERD